MVEPRALLAKLDLSEAEIDVYLALLNGAHAPREVVVTTGRSRPTVYYALTSLERRGLLSKTGLEGEQRYRLEQPRRLKTIVRQRQDAMQSLEAEVDDFVAQFQMSVKSNHKPDVAFYEGVAAVRNVIMETVYARSRMIETLVPTNNFFWQLGPDFVEKYMELRHTLGVRTRNLWATSIERSIIDQFYNLADIRMLPVGLGDRFRSTIFIHDDQVLYISSLASGHAFLVRSPEHAELMRVLYNVLWDSSTSIQQ